MIRGYPQEAVLRDGKRLLIRPFAEHDTPALYEFFENLSVGVRRFAWDNVLDRALVEASG